MDTTRLLDQLKADEGFSPKAYWDVKQWTYGYGCEAPHGGATITEPLAADLLLIKLNQAIASYNRIFTTVLPEINDVRAEALTNMIFNMGPGLANHPEVGGLQSFTHTLHLILCSKPIPWDEVADHFMQSLWFKQVANSGNPPGRGNRLIEQIRRGVE